jgi:hypothetical protein
VVECKYRGRVIGWLVTNRAGEGRYLSTSDGWEIHDDVTGRYLLDWKRRNFWRL